LTFLSISESFDSHFQVRELTFLSISESFDSQFHFRELTFLSISENFTSESFSEICICISDAFTKFPAAKRFHINLKQNSAFWIQFYIYFVVFLGVAVKVMSKFDQRLSKLHQSLIKL